MNWPSGGQWEWAIGEFVVLAFLIWELYHLRQIQRRDREKAQREQLQTQSKTDLARGENRDGETPSHKP
jgi:hypothetical protein